MNLSRVYKATLGKRMMSSILVKGGTVVNSDRMVKSDVLI